MKMWRIVGCLSVVLLAAGVSAGAGGQASSLAAANPWTGDFDGMVARRLVRILTPYSRTHYFIDKGQPRGLVHEAAVALEEEIISGSRQLGPHACSSW